MGRAGRRLAGFAICLALTPPLPAIETFSVAIGEMRAEGFHARGVALSLSLGAAGIGGRLEVAELALEGESYGALRADCTELSLDARYLHCRDGRFRLEHAWLDAPAFSGDLSLPRDGAALRFALRDVRFAGGELELRGELGDGLLQARAQLRDLDLAQLAALFPEQLPAGLVQGQGYVAGGLNGGVRFSYDGVLRAAAGELGFTGVGFSDEVGLLAADALAGELSFDLDTRDAWRGPVALQLATGELYAQPGFLSDGVYLNLVAHPLALSGTLELIADQRLSLTGMQLDHAGVVSGSGRLSQDLVSGDATLALDRFQGQLPDLYRIWIEPFYYGTTLARLQTAGAVSGHILLEAGDLREIGLMLDAVSVVAPAERFEVFGMDGAVRWAAAGEARTSEIAWDSGLLFGLTAGAGAIRIAASGDDMRLLEPTRTALLDGALVLDRLEVRDLRSDDPSFKLQLALEPLDLGELSRALGWPELGGRVSARIPELSYTAGQLSLGGRMEAEVFDGRIEVENLRIRDPFGVLPRIRADLRLRRLDLQALTGTFALGSISGRLDGEILGLRMAGDEATAFDARLYTSPERPGERRISQRAIESLSSIGGGGVGDRLSRGFLRTFKSFGYEKLGIRCVLVDEVCRMGGVERAEGDAYYLVKGRGLPRIDVVGDREQVDWPALEAKLREWAYAAGEGGG